MANEIIVGDKRFPCAVQVVTWYESQLGFPGLKTRDTKDLIVLHWTGSDNGAKECHRTLQTRRDKDGKLLGLSVQFFVDAKGLVHQFSDALTSAQHAGPRGNKRGVGIEIANRADANREVRGVVRALVKETINSKTTIRTTFTAAQVRSTLALVEALCGALSIPYAVPMAGADVFPNILSDAALAEFRGVCCHFHLEMRKQDAGLAILRSIAAKPMRGVDGAAE